MEPSRSSAKNYLDGFGSYPHLRDHPLKTATQWLKGRRLDNGCGDLWRVHDKLYDLSGFVDSHPGGRMWLEVTRGTDITEAFESSHLDGQKVEAILAKFYRKEATNKRQSPFTFEPDGFYRTLKRRAHFHLKHNVTKEEKDAGPKKVRDMQNRLLFALFALIIISARFASYPIAVIAGLVMTLNINLAHNFFHRTLITIRITQFCHYDLQSESLFFLSFFFTRARFLANVLLRPWITLVARMARHSRPQPSHLPKHNLGL